MSGPRAGVARALTRSCDGLLAVALVVFVVSTVPGVRSESGFDVLLDGWLQGGANVLVGLAAMVRPLADPRRRVFWSVVAVALVLRAVGFVLYLSHVRLQQPLPYPSVADLAWVSSSLAFVVAAWLLAREHVPRVSRLLALDAAIGAATVGGLVVAALYRPLVGLTPVGTPADVVATNLAYPLVDVAMVVLVGGVLASTGWRPSPSVALFATGVTASAAVDVVFLYTAAAGTYRPGTWIAALTISSAVAIAWSGRLSEETQETRSEGSAPIVATAGLAMVCVFTLLREASNPEASFAAVLSGVGIVLALVRGVLTLRSLRAETSVVMAAKDEEIERFQALVEASDDFIAIADTDQTIRYINPAGRCLVGLPDDLDVTATVISDYTPALAREGLQDGRPGLLERGTWRGHSELLDHRGGPGIPVSANTFVLRHPETGEPWSLATVQRDISELRSAQADLQALVDERRTLLSHLVEAQEVERASIAADVHDDAVQALAAVDLQLGLLRRQLGDADPEVTGILDLLHTSVRGANDRLRHLLFDLDSPAQRADLHTVLEEAAATIFEDRVRWQVECADGVDLPEEQRVAAHRMAKEAMVNVVKHAGAERVEVTVERVDGGVRIDVADDGVGIEPDDLLARPGHRGLSDVHDRAAIGGGWVTVEPRPEGGTLLRIWLPASADPA